MSEQEVTRVLLEISGIFAITTALVVVLISISDRLPKDRPIAAVMRKLRSYRGDTSQE